MRPNPYPSDLTDVQWALLKPHLPAAHTCGRPRSTDLREVINAIFYRNRNGCVMPSSQQRAPPVAAHELVGCWPSFADE